MAVMVQVQATGPLLKRLQRLPLRAQTTNFEGFRVQNLHRFQSLPRYFRTLVLGELRRLRRAMRPCQFGYYHHHHHRYHLLSPKLPENYLPLRAFPFQFHCSPFFPPLRKEQASWPEGPALLVIIEAARLVELEEMLSLALQQRLA